MTDKELLELAAKAAGIDHPDGEHSRYDDGRLWDCNGLRWWNPLTDDGDALHLAVKLKIPMKFPDWSDQCATWGREDSNEQFIEAALDHNGDLYAATRRAIVRAAAEIGKNK